ncbi:MAG: carbamoyltransferase HypF [Kiritimatiellae bacterium]|nr:carbamoyltransferase HypF [Kiritimatiellia bacterium]MDW8458013.1 carbamoyltransferase HypF [Verrucomicrobiota bacterium]
MELLVTGAVQGVGFRPLVFRIAHRLGLGGAVWNEPGGVRIRLVGPPIRVELFAPTLRRECQLPARIDQIRVLSVSEADAPEPFRIADSSIGGTREALVMPDLATCPACLRELFDPRNRRYRHPFINCTRCGPRYSIITGIPYDRERTTMRDFPMCSECRAEFENPEDRRFHAQPIACPRCGPAVELLDARGTRIGGRDWAVRETVRRLRAGQIVAVKGIGGFHLMCDARSEETVRELRRRKRRDEKPFALMVPDLAWARELAELSDLEIDLLLSAAAPIVLVARRMTNGVAESVAPRNPQLGLMLPYAPIHHMILREFSAPLVATSGNLSDEPICIDEREAVERLAGIADAFLVHNRPIARPQDDSVARVVDRRVCMIRRARGYAPLAIPLPFETRPVLALGAHLKNTIALAFHDRIVLSQHHGDLDSWEARRAFEQAVEDLPALYGVRPEIWAVDAHPDYATSLYARDHGLQAIPIQHHHAHIAAAMAEHGLEGTVLGVAWDGTGLGSDGTIWGGEFLLVSRSSFLRIGRLSCFRLPGGDSAMRKPVHSAFGVLSAACPDKLPELAARVLEMDEESIRICAALIRSGENAPLTSSAGRWFDAASALLGACRRATYEGQAAQMLEFLCRGTEVTAPYPYELRTEESVVVFDLAPVIRALLDEIRTGAAPSISASRFHNTMADIIATMAQAHPNLPVVLSGGCFQNRVLLSLAIRRLRELGRQVYFPEQVPPNDGGISLGQAAIVAWRLNLGPKAP